MGVSDEAVEAAARAHDAEDAAQKGEPSPWTHFNCGDETVSEADCPDCREFKADRMAAMRAALTAALPFMGMGEQGSSQDAGGHPVSALLGADCTLFIVVGSTGEYSDRSEWPVRAFRSKGVAEAFVTFLTAKRQELGPSGGFDYTRSGVIAAEMEKFDPNYSEDYTGTSWFIWEVAFADGPKGQDGQLRDEQIPTTPATVGRE